MIPTWSHYATKSVGYDSHGRVVASVHPNQIGFASEFLVEVYDRGKLVSRRGAKSIEDGVGVARAVLASIPDTAVPEVGRLDADTLRKLVEEGVELRKEFESRTAGTRVLTPDDLKTRSD